MNSVFTTLLEHGHPLITKKKHTILQQLEISKKIYFIKEGVVRHFVIDKDGNDKTLRISKEGDMFFSSIVSFFRSEPTYIICETLTPCTLVTWEKQKIDALITEYPEIEQFRYEKLIDFIIEKHDKEMSLMMHSAEKRFQDFCAQNNELFNRIPHYVIASYLNISPEMLSRLRKRKFIDPHQ